jgi:hypothetical protein
VKLEAPQSLVPVKAARECWSWRHQYGPAYARIIHVEIYTGASWRCREDRAAHKAARDGSQRPIKKEILNLFQTDTSFRWIKGLLKAKETATTINEKSTTGYGSRFDIAKQSNLDMKDSAQLKLLDQIGAKCESDDNWDSGPMRVAMR